MSEAINHSTDILRLLMSSRDPGAASNTLEIARQADADPRFELKILAQGPAINLFRDEGLPVHFIDSPSCTSTNSPAYDSLQIQVENQLDSFNPDATLVGLSSPDIGIDEILTASNAHDHTYTFQDFWGDVNTNLSTIPDTFFVIDELAQTLTENRTGNRTIVTGMPKYAKYRDMDISEYRNQALEESGTDKDSTIATVYGQPFWNHPGYSKTLGILQKQVENISKIDCLYYRPHPKENKREYRSLIKSGYRLDKLKSPEASLAVTNIALSCFSTCLLDYIMLNKQSPEPLGTPVYTLFPDDLRDFYSSYGNIDVIPPVANGWALSIENHNDTEAVLRESLNEQTQSTLQHQAKNDLPDSTKAVNKILDTIYEDFNSD